MIISCYDIVVNILQCSGVKIQLFFAMITDIVVKILQCSGV